MKKFIDSYVLVFILFLPFLYLYISYGIKIKVDLELLGFILFSMFFIVIYIYLFVNNVKRNLLIGYLIFMLLAIGSTFISYTNSFDTFKFIATILYLPVIVMFFSNYDNKLINQKYLSYIYLIFTAALTFSYIFKFNEELALTYKKGFIGLFYGSNIISPILAILMPIALDYAYKCKSYIVKILFYVCTVVSIIFVGTKTVFASLIVYAIYCILKLFKKKPQYALILATLLSAVIIVLPLVPQYQSFRTDLVNRVFNDDQPLVAFEDFDNVVFHNKLSKTRVEFNSINNHNFRYKFILNNDYNPIGIDLVDLFLTLGLAGFILYIAFFVVALADSKLSGLYKLIFIMMIFASFFQGNIFTSYLVYIFVGLLFIVCRQDDDETKILLVSNMYPNKKFPSYGIFVKNTYDSLTTNYSVDKVVMYKHNFKIVKLFAYMMLHTRAFIKILFNDYDYVYIHYVSHSSHGAVLASHLMKNIKIIFNAHGNDVVPDTEIDAKNVERSKKFLQSAYKVVVPSKYYQDVMINEYNVDAKNVVVYPSGGIDLDFFKNIPKDEAKKTLNFDDKTKYIGYISRIEKDKGYDTFINAVKILSDNKKFNKYKFIVVGYGSEFNQLQQLITDNELSEKVMVVEKINREELVTYYNALDLFVFPTKRKSESLGLVGLEAMACGTPVVSSNAKGPMSYITNKKNAYVFKQDNPEDLAAVIEKVVSLEDKELNKLIDNGYKTASEYDSKKVENTIIKLFSR